jgi:hypothetical protein
MTTAREGPQAADSTSVQGNTRGHPRERTGVRFVLTNVADPSRADDYSAWYDDYESAIIHPGLIANAFRFENPNAAGTATDPRYAAVYDIVSPEPGSAWPDTEDSPDYPRYLFDDPRSRLVVPTLRASYALTGSLESDKGPRLLTGVHIILSDGAGDTDTDTLLAQWAGALLETDFFYSASRFRIIEGSPTPPEWLEIFETDFNDPLTAYARAVATRAPQPRGDRVRQRSSHSLALVAAH